MANTMSDLLSWLLLQLNKTILISIHLEIYWLPKCVDVKYSIHKYTLRKIYVGGPFHFYAFIFFVVIQQATYKYIYIERERERWIQVQSSQIGTK